MKFENAMDYLRSGSAIYRTSKPDQQLHGSIEKVKGSFYLTIYDVLANDWSFCYCTTECNCERCIDRKK